MAYIRKRCRFKFCMSFLLSILNGFEIDCVRLSFCRYSFYRYSFFDIVFVDIVFSNFYIINHCLFKNKKKDTNQVVNPADALLVPMVDDRGQVVQKQFCSQFIQSFRFCQKIINKTAEQQQGLSNIQTFIPGGNIQTFVPGSFQPWVSVQQQNVVADPDVKKSCFHIIII